MLRNLDKRRLEHAEWTNYAALLLKEKINVKPLSTEFSKISLFELGKKRSINSRENGFPADEHPSDSDGRKMLCPKSDVTS